MWREVVPIKVGLDSSVQVVSAEVWYKHCGVHEGRCQACQDAAKEDRMQGQTLAFWGGSNQEQGFSVISGVLRGSGKTMIDGGQRYPAGHWGCLLISSVRMACMPLTMRSRDSSMGGTWCAGSVAKRIM